VKAFYYVGKLKSITKAAEYMHVSQPAVSQSMKQLENHTGCKLVTRASGGIKFTKEGEDFYSYVKRGYEILENGTKKMSQLMDLDGGELIIGASDMTLQYFLLPYLERFHEDHPSVKVIVTNAPTPETLENLRESTIDFGLISSPFEESDNLIVTKVREIEDIFVAARKFLPYKNRMLDLSELEDMPIISLEGKTSTRRYMESFLEENGVKMNPEFELATSDMIVQFALRNLGVGSIVSDFAEEYLEDGKLFKLRFNKRIPKRSFCLVQDKRAYLSPAAKELLRYIKEDVVLHE
jgi:DNA-binding transcriptional LysR family regulator